MKSLAVVTLVALLLTVGIAFDRAYSADNAQRITKEQLLPMLGNPDVIILDVRQPKDWNGSQSKIKGAVRLEPTKDAASAINKLPKEKTIVFYCS